MDINLIKEAIVKIGNTLVSKKLIARTWGNISQRINNEYMVITPSGKEYSRLTKEDILEVNINTLEYSSKLKPSSEKGMHAMIYKTLPNMNSVIHTHQEYASIISVSGIKSIDVNSKYKSLGSKIVCCKYGLPGSKKLSNNVKNVVTNNKDIRVVIMENHGVLCFGEDYETAINTAIELENFIREYIEEKYLGVSKAEIVNIEEMYKFIFKKENLHISSLKSKDFKVRIEGVNIMPNRSLEAVALSYREEPLLPLLDDFAQIVGTKMEVVTNDTNKIKKALRKSSAVFIKGYGAICCGATECDTKAISMILEKNCKAYLLSKLLGGTNYIGTLDSMLMRFVYLKKYSKQI